MPTPAKTTFRPSGLTLTAHEALALKLRHVVRDLQDLRAVVHTALGELEAYAAVSEALGQARRLALALAETLPGAGAEALELRALYLQPEEPPSRGHGSSLQGSSLTPLNGRRPLAGEGH